MLCAVIHKNKGNSPKSVLHISHHLNEPGHFARILMPTLVLKVIVGDYATSPPYDEKKNILVRNLLGNCTFRPKRVILLGREGAAGTVCGLLVQLCCSPRE